MWSVLVNLLAAAKADQTVTFDPIKYENGDYGPYVTRSYYSSDVVSPRLNFLAPFTGCDDGSFLFVAPRGNHANSMPYILDASGDLIWTADHHYGEIYNFQAQHYKGKQYLTFWAGDDTVKGHGAGRYYMLDQNYGEYRQVRGANSIEADLHEFFITNDDTALITAYQVIQIDIRSINGHDSEGYIWDSVFQEINIETGQAIFQWRASEHVDLTESYDAIGDKGSKYDPWDFFHINSVDKDSIGNYLVSSRYLRSILYISGTSGDVLWRLGGKLNSLTDLSPTPVNFVGQHHARWADNYTAITFFDNRADWSLEIDDNSVGTKLLVDLDQKTFKLDRVFANSLHKVLSVSQGSYQALPNGNVLLGYGVNAVVTEFSPEGKVLCDAHIGEPSSRLGSGDVQSYRNYKFNWTGTPNTRPCLKLWNGTLYMSWLGSTEVQAWSIRHAYNDTGEYSSLTTFRKEGFETAYEFPNDTRIYRYIRAVALNEHGKDLAFSVSIDATDDSTFWDDHGVRELIKIDAHEPDQPEDDNEYDDEDEYEEDGVVEVEWVNIEESMVLCIAGFLLTITGALILFVCSSTKSRQHIQARPQYIDLNYKEARDNCFWKRVKHTGGMLRYLFDRRDHEEQQIALLEACRQSA